MTKIFSQLEQFGDRIAIIDESGRAHSYLELAALADATVRDLGPERRLVFIEITNTLAPIAAYVGAMRAGHVAALMGEHGGRADQPFSKVFSPEFVFTEADGDWSFQPRPSTPTALHPDLALLLSTSGSTGSPKAVRLSHANLFSNARSIAEYLEFLPGERAITSLPPSYSYGMSVINSHLETGGALILSSESVSDEAFWQRFRRFEATSFAGVPHTYELLERTRLLETDCPPSLRYFTQAGGRLPPDKVQSFAHLAEQQGKRFYVMYGQTEASPRMAYVPPRDLAEHPDVIGRAVPGGELRVEPVEGGDAASTAGELVYRGPNVMMGYALAREDLALEPQLDELRTGDLAVVGAKGYFRIVGRASRFCKIFGLRIGLDEVEQILLRAGVEAAATGDDEALVAATVTKGRADDARRLLAEKLKLPLSRISVVEVAEIPRHPSGKVNYPAILRLKPKAAPEAQTNFRGKMAEALGVEAIADSDTFVGLGGDSLSYVQASLLLEAEYGSVPDDWENMTFGELARLRRPEKSRVASLECSIFVRAIAIMLVVFKHVSGWDMGGAATTLLIIVGLNFSRFQLPQLNSGQSTSLLKSTALRVALPYFVVISIYFVAVGSIFLPQYLLYSNFTDGFIFDGKRRFSVYWFIEIYLTLIVLLCLLYLIPQVRAASKAHPKRFAIGAFALTTTLALIAKPLNDIPLFYNHTPISFAYVFAYGWMLDALKTQRERLILLAIGAATLVVLPTDEVLTALPIVAAGTLMLLFVKRVPVGSLLARPLAVIANSSLYIYITHGLILHPTRVILGGEQMVPGWMYPVIWAIALLVGVGLTQAIQLLNSGRLRSLLVQLQQLQTPGRSARLRDAP